eukprot:15325113-Alexandrium_andersonii.AAC.1
MQGKADASFAALWYCQEAFSASTTSLARTRRSAKYRPALLPQQRSETRQREGSLSASSWREIRRIRAR